MEPEAEDPESNQNLVPWSGSDCSQELCPSESFDEEEDDIIHEFPSETQCPHTPKSESPKCSSPQDWESAGEQLPLSELSGSEENVSYQEDEEENDNMYLRQCRESPHIQTSAVLLPSPCPDRQDSPYSQPRTGQASPQRSSLSSSPPSSTPPLVYAADLTLALTLKAEEPQGASERQQSVTGNRRVESSVEGGSSQAPPASVFFEISDEGAEQAEKWNSGSDTDLCRPDRHRGRFTRISQSESQSERHVKETKSKCKRIARLLTDAPNPQNKGALLFNKRRQRVKKYTLVSYGTGEKLDSEEHIEEESEEVRSAGYNFVVTSDSDLEEEYSDYHQQCNRNLNWGSVREMDALPETKGKGVMMFAQRRRRMDEIVSEQEELRRKGIPVEVAPEPAFAGAQDIYDTKEMYMHSNQDDYMDKSHKQQEYQEHFQQMNHVASVPRPFVPNRTARPFLGFQDGRTAAAMQGGTSPVTKKSEPRFKVPVPTINNNPLVWSPTGDIIASRDERISVPAIKTGMMPEPKRKGTTKQSSALAQGSDSLLQRRGDRRSYIESEEDYFSLGAEACNFMQPRPVKLKNPPPVAPKPIINPVCPPWISRSPTGEPYIPPRSPVSQPSPSPHSPHYLQQQDWAQSQQMANRWAPDQAQATLQTPANAWGPVNISSQRHLQPTTNSGNQQVLTSPVSMQARSPTYSPHTPSQNKSDSVSKSVASCPPQTGMSFVQATPKAQVSGRGAGHSGDGSAMVGKGAALFAKRQSRMEKFVVDAETVQANKSRMSSPTSSLPNYWRYSSNVRAPPPLSYNPLLSPYHPQPVAKQPPPKNAKVKPKTNEKPKAPPKHLDALDIMKHQPYQLNSSLFKYDAVPEVKSPSPIPSLKPTPASKFEARKNLKLRSLSSHSTHTTDAELAAQAKSEASGSVSSEKSSASPNTKAAEPVATNKRFNVKHVVTPAAKPVSNKQAPSSRPTSAASQHSSTADSLALAFSPASLIARGAQQMAPRPKFSAKKPMAAGKQWKPVAISH